MHRYNRQPLREGPFYRPGPFLWQGVPQPSKDVSRILQSIRQPTSLLSEDPPSALTEGSSSARANSDTQRPSTLPIDTWTSNCDETRFFLAGSINLWSDERDFKYIGNQFKGRFYVNKEPRQQVESPSALNGVAEHRVILSKDARDVQSADLSIDKCQVWQSSPNKPTPRETTVVQSRGSQLLEEQFRLLFRTSPSLLDLYSCVHQGHGNSGDGSQGTYGNPLTPNRTRHSDKESDQTRDNKPNQDENGQNNENDKNDKNDKGSKDFARKRFLERFQESEFLCVVFVGDRELALEAGCAFHNPSIGEVHRHLINTHCKRFPQIDEALSRILEKHSPKRNCRNPVALWKLWHELIFHQKQIQPGSWFYNPRRKRILLGASTSTDEILAGSIEPLRRHNSHSDDQANFETIEEKVMIATREAYHNPDIVIAIQTHDCEIHSLKRKRDRDLEEVDSQYEEDLSEGRKRAREARDAREEQVGREFERAKTEVDVNFKRKIACARKAMKDDPLVHAAQEALNAQLSQGDAQPGTEASQPRLQLPPSPFPTSTARSRTSSDGPPMDGSNLTPCSSNTRPTWSSNGDLSSPTPCNDTNKMDPRIRVSSNSGMSVDDLGLDPAPQTDYPSPELATEYCMDGNCHRKSLEDERYCGEHYNRARHGSD